MAGSPQAEFPTGGELVVGNYRTDANSPSLRTRRTAQWHRRESPVAIRSPKPETELWSHVEPGSKQQAGLVIRSALPPTVPTALRVLRRPCSPLDAPFHCLWMWDLALRMHRSVPWVQGSVLANIQPKCRDSGDTSLVSWHQRRRRQRCNRGIV